MAKATASPPARRHNGDRLRGKAKPQRHQTKETPPPKHESAWKHENKPGLHSPFSLNQIGTLSRRHLAQFVSAIDTYERQSCHWVRRGCFLNDASAPIPAAAGLQPVRLRAAMVIAMPRETILMVFLHSNILTAAPAHAIAFSVGALV